MTNFELTGCWLGQMDEIRKMEKKMRIPVDKTKSSDELGRAMQLMNSIRGAA